MAKVDVSQTNNLDEIENKVNEKVKKEMQEKMLEKNKEELDQKQQKLKDTMFKYAEKYGAEDFRTQLIASMYDVSVLMKEQVDMIEGITTAMSYMTSTLGFIDEMLDFQNDMLDLTLKAKYGPFSKIKQFFRMRKVKRNVNRRMNAVANQIASIQDISTTIVDAFKNATVKMQRKIAINKEKQAKKHNKNNIAPVQNDSEANRLIQEHLSGSGEVSPTRSATGDSKPASGTDKYDDVL